MAGMILFQAALNAPTIFKVYSEEQAGPFLRAIFPKLFLNVAVLSLIGVVLTVIGDRLSLQILFFVSFLLMSISYLIVPSTNKARDEAPIANPDTLVITKEKSTDSFKPP